MLRGSSAALLYVGAPAAKLLMLPSTLPASSYPRVSVEHYTGSLKTFLFESLPLAPYLRPPSNLLL